jgi:hypothetical protein
VFHGEKGSLILELTLFPDRVESRARSVSRASQALMPPTGR